MSLHLGNLSTRVSRNELERVFWRFGQCNVQVKDKFGFVVYNFPEDAEKALRTLRGKNICGEPITLSWSNIQPRASQRYRRSGRAYESQSGRRRSREDYANQKSGSGVKQDYRISEKQTDADGRRIGSVNLGDEMASYSKENIEVNIGVKEHAVGDNLPVEGATIQPIPLDHEAEQANHLLNDNIMENGVELERYDPNFADIRRDDEDDFQRITFSGGSPDLRKSQKKEGTEQTRDTALKHPDNVKSLQTCYSCGKLGHKKRNCPTGQTSNKKRLSRFSSSHDAELYYRGKSEDELRRPRSNSWRRLQAGSNAVRVRKHRSDRNETGYRMLMGKHSPLAKGTHRSRREEHQVEKRRRTERRSPTRHQLKKVRGAESSLIHSDYTASRSRSNSKSASRFSSQSRLEFSKPASLPSDTTSHSASHCSKFGNSKMASKSRSSSPASSSPVSLRQTLPSSPKEVQINQMSLVNSASPEPKGYLNEREQLESCALQPVGENEDIYKTLLGRNDVYHDMIGDADKGENTPALGLEQDSLAAEIVSAKDVCVAKDHISVPTNNMHTEFSTSSHTSTGITPEEMNMVLKHYGMEQLDKQVHVEGFFGSARLWPWEIIYYRRLRKGPMSIENYARRVYQNKEFGIVDKYIRSSSGWGELSNS